MTWVDGASAADFAAAAKSYAETNSINPIDTKTADGTEVIFEKLPLGYYLVDSSLGSLCSLDTTATEVIIKEKNSETTIEKEVKEGDTWGETSDARIGDTVEYRSIITVGDGTINLVMHDVMEEGLTFNANSVAATDSKGGKPAFSVSTAANDGCTFEVAFTDGYVATLSKGDTITVTYNAVLNEKAEIKDESNDNKVKVTFGEKSSSEWDTTRTYTYQFDLVKTDENGKVITGAEFALYDAQTAGNKIPVVAVSENDITGEYVYRVATDEEIAAGADAIIKAGKATIIGLDSKVYYLEETKQPSGYNKLTDRIAADMTRKENNNATISSDGSAYGTYDEGGVQIINKAGTELPGTGGMGTTLFYAAGSLLMLISFILLVTMRRMNHAR